MLNVGPMLTANVLAAVANRASMVANTRHNASYLARPLGLKRSLNRHRYIWLQIPRALREPIIQNP